MLFNMNPGILFYQCKITNQDGDSIKDVWGYDYTEYERGHYFIQWMFPSDEPSSVNSSAPVVDKEFQDWFHGNVTLRLRLKKSYMQFLDFIGVDRTDNGLKVVDQGRFYLRVRNRNHNLQRITRVLRSLTILGLHDHAVDFHKFLMQYKREINQVTLDYWDSAIQILE